MLFGKLDKDLVWYKNGNLFHYDCYAFGDCFFLFLYETFYISFRNLDVSFSCSALATDDDDEVVTYIVL
jgi:hypothetical protein